MVTFSRFLVFPPSSLPPLKLRLSLLHERPPTLLIILASKTGIHQTLAKCQISVIRIFANLRDNLLAGFNSQGGIARDGFGVSVHKGVYFILRQDPVDESHIVGFRRIKLSGSEQNLFGADRDQRARPTASIRHNRSRALTWLRGYRILNRPWRDAGHSRARFPTHRRCNIP